MAFRGASAGSGSGGSVVASAPASVQIGDMMIWYINTDVNGGTITYPAGWVQFPGTPFSDVAEASTHAFAWKIRAGGEVFTATNSSANDFSWNIGAWSGRAAVAPSKGANKAGDTPQTTTINMDANGVTVALGDDIVVFYGLDPLTNTAAQSLTTPPAGYTERADDTSGDWVQACMVTLDNASAGATGTLTGVGTITAGHEAGYGALVFFMSPAVAGSEGTRAPKRGPGNRGPVKMRRFITTPRSADLDERTNSFNPSSSDAIKSTGMGPGRGVIGTGRFRTRFFRSTRDFSPPPTSISLDITSQGILNLQGQTALFSIGMPVQAGALNLVGQSITSNINVPISSQGVLTINGQTINISVPLSLDIATAGVLTLAGQAMAFSINMPVQNGGLVISGQAFTHTINMPIANGSLTLTGQTMTAIAEGNLALLIDTPGILRIDGQSVTMFDSGATPAVGSDYIIRARRRHRR